MRIGITGQSGFIGSHLYNNLGLFTSEYESVNFCNSYFEDFDKLCSFVRKCDVIIHLAAMNRHEDPNIIYETNILLTQRLIDAMEKEKVKPHVIFSSSIQEELDNLYGKSKKECRSLLENWAHKENAFFTGLLIPNVFGEFSEPNYNTFIATFAYKLINDENPIINNNNNVKLIYIANLCHFIIKQINNKSITQIFVPYDFETTVEDILNLFRYFNAEYRKKGVIPEMKNRDEINLFNTFRSYMPITDIQLKKNTDERGSFVEVARLCIGGQVSFSTTLPNITRGNHYHTRKIERFIVIKGKASIELRKINSNQVIKLELDGENPSYVDIPVWYTHNITNIGNNELYTIFWINEPFNSQNPDTYFEKV